MCDLYWAHVRVKRSEAIGLNLVRTRVEDGMRMVRSKPQSLSPLHRTVIIRAGCSVAMAVDMTSKGSNDKGRGEEATHDRGGKTMRGA